MEVGAVGGWWSSARELIMAVRLWGKRRWLTLTGAVPDHRSPIWRCHMTDERQTRQRGRSVRSLSRLAVDKAERKLHMRKQTAARGKGRVWLLGARGRTSQCRAVTREVFQ